jgi:Arm domain-containing DNA-binding protein
MPSLTLTTRSIGRLKLPPDTDDIIFWDQGLSGFGRRLHRTAGASWVIQYRNRKGHSRRMMIGPGALPLAAARKSAIALLAKIKLGEDPQGDKIIARTRAAHLPLGNVFKDFIADRCAKWRPSTDRQYRHPAHLFQTDPRPLCRRSAAGSTRADRPHAAAD